ncbi:GGDEF domain-containing protein [Xylophilus sp. ASV27]|uniref:GGDEF domain-containing protein n=1 Tax=Xylophilus sp. ASV27 TaxID=2795129 RepID=UPI0018EB4E70|nr:sensor domain-containing diguanylate cyclase [Xylophilus sp. ASV27]
MTGVAHAPSPARGATARLALGTRLMLATLGFCLAFTLVTVAARTWSAWRGGIASMAADLSLLEQVFQPALERSVWDMDREALQVHVGSLASAEPVGRVELVVTSDNRPTETFSRQREGWESSRMAPTRRVELVHVPFAGRQETVGLLTLYGDERVLWSRLQREALAIGLTQLIQSLLLASLVVLVFSRLVTQHVRRIAEHLEQLSAETLDRPLVLQRPAGRRDELSQLEAGVNHLQANLSDHLRRQQRYEHELAGHRDRLAELVQARTVELEAANHQLQTLSRTDPLTGLANRRHFDEAAATEFKRARRSGRPLCLLLADLDYFKRYNDRHGHAAGDASLVRIAGTLRDCASRAGELVARIGGEEFAVLLPDTQAAQGRALAQRICDAVARLDIAHGASEVAPHITLSVGVAQYDPQGTPDFAALFQEADAALYRSKHRGRNQASG